MTALYWFIKHLGAPIVRCIFNLEFHGKENIPTTEKGFILCSNHTSMSDVIVLVIGCPRMIHFMAKEEIFKKGFLTWFFNNMGAFPVARGTGGTKAIETAEKLIEDGNVMGIFPEGTRNKENTAPKKAKSGVALIASKTGADVLPCCVYREGKLHFRQKITIRYGEPISAEEMAMKDDSRQELRRVSSLLMNKVTELWEKHHGE